MMDNKIKILLVEDNPGDVRLIEEMIKETGVSQFKLSVEGTLKGALGCLRKESFEGVMLDLNLPDCQGLATLKSIQGNCSRVAVIVITGLDDEAIAIESLRMGAEDFLIKGKFDSFLLVRSLRYVTERKKAEEELHILSLVVKESSEAIGMSTPEGKHYFQNKAFDNLFGNVGENPRVSLYIDEQVGQEVFATIMAGHLWSGEVKMRAKTGDLLDIMLHAHPIKDIDGKVVAIVGVHTDITERKKIEEVLNQSEKEKSLILNSTKELFIYYTTNLEIVWANNAASEAFGKKPSELKGVNCHSLFFNNDAPCNNCPLLKVLETGKSEGQEIETSDGRFWFVRGYPVFDENHNIINLIEFALEITERKKAEEEIRYLKDYNENILESNPNPMMVVKGTQIEYVNKSFVSIFGETKNEYIARNLKDVVPLKIFPVFENLLQEDGRSNELKFRGKEFIVHSFVIKKAEEEEEEEEEETRSGMVFQDISERKRAEEALRESERRHRILFESSQDAIMTLEPPSWKFTTGNPATIEMFKAKNEKEFTSQGPGNLSPECQPDGRDSAEKAKEMIETAMRNGSCFFEWTHKRMTGEDFFATVLLSKVQQDEKVFLQATVRDITKQKQLEIQLKEKIDELERFKKLTVDRELKMIDLKEQIKKLEEKLKEEK